MPRVIVTHNVKDVQQWLQFHAERVEVMRPFGLVGGDVVDYVASDGSNAVAFAAEVESVPTPGTRPESVAAAERHGVVPPASIFIEA